jgi:asparagine synthase (glutamine-hydrolysing)
MCAIAGWQIDPAARRSAHELAAMLQSIAHRGPDDEGGYLDANHGIRLAHRRLAIIDLGAGGHQPMPSGDGSVVLVFNGELYNYVLLRNELQSLGIAFRSRSDTEVVANALAQWGEAALRRFDGMFALAAWYPKSAKLLLARDPMGMKPLYYARLRGGGIAFASEVKAFLALGGFKAEVDLHSLQQYLEFGYVFDPYATILSGVSKLPPGCLLEIAAGRASEPRAYCALSTPTSTRPDRRARDDIADALYETLREVVQQHLVADVPVGLLLSGGLDSSLIAAFAARDTKIATISMGFAESTIDERPFARIAAEHIRSDHREVLIHQREVVQELEEIVWYFDDLFADWGTVSTRLLYKKCGDQGIKVVLVGEGADELFGGYPIFHAAQRVRGPLSWQLFQLYRRYAGRRYGREFAAFATIMRGYLRERGGSLFEAVRLFESRNQLPNNYVMKVDKASMSVSVEARAPYLDRRVAQLAYAVPEEHLVAGETNKLILRRVAERHRLLPPEIFERAKFGASIATSWMESSDEFRRYARQVVLAREGWVDRLGLRGAMTEFFNGSRTGYRFPHAIGIFNHLAWRLLLLNLWSRKYLAMR